MPLYVDEWLVGRAYGRLLDHVFAVVIRSDTSSAEFNCRAPASAFTYFPTCSHVSVRAKQHRISPIRTDLFRTALPLARLPVFDASRALFKSANLRARGKASRIVEN
jgi:hypothetical protein